MSPTRGFTALASIFSSPGSSAAVELAPRRVTAVALDRQAGRPVVAAHATEPLPPGVIQPGIAAPNVADEALVAEALRRVFERLGRTPRRVALVVPDSSAKVSLVRFERVPARSADLDQLVRWQVRKAAPFRLEDARVSYTPGLALPDEGRQFVVVLARRDIVEQYERVLAAAGAHAGIVDLATFNLINLVLATGGGADNGRPDWLLVNVGPEASTIAVVRGADLIFFRHRVEAEGGLADLVHQTAMYYEDRLGGSGFARVVVAGGGGADGAALYGALEERLSVPVAAIDPRAAAPLRDRIDAPPELLDALAAPVGVLLRE